MSIKHKRAWDRVGKEIQEKDQRIAELEKYEELYEECRDMTRLAEYEKRIAELEAENARLRNDQTCVPCDTCQRGFHPKFMYNEGGKIRCANCVIKNERETLVPNDLLEELIESIDFYSDEGSGLAEILKRKAQAILDKRREGDAKS